MTCNLMLPHEDNVLNKFTIWKERRIRIENRTGFLVGLKIHPTTTTVVIIPGRDSNSQPRQKRR